MAEVTILGSPFVDLMYGFPLPGTGDKLAEGIDLKLTPGGPAANVATGLARLGCNSAVNGKVGADWFGRYIKSSLQNEGVGTSGLSAETGKSTGIVFPILDEDGKQVSYELINEPVQFEFGRTELESDYFSGQDYLFADGVMILGSSSADTLSEGVKLADKAGVSVIFDPNFRLPTSALEDKKEVIVSVLERTEYLLLNREEIEIFRALFWPGLQMAKVKEKLIGFGLDAMVEKKGSCGHEVIDEKQGVAYDPFPVEQVDHEGAGDGFDAGFIAGLVAGLDVHNASKMGAAVGALVCTGRTAWEPLPRVKELRRFLKEEGEDDLIQLLEANS